MSCLSAASRPCVVIDFDDGIQRAEEVFRAIQRVDVRLGRIFMEHFIGIEHHCRDAERVGLVADYVTFIVRDRGTDDYAADMPGSKNF